MSRSPHERTPRVAVVGPCASGKTTLVDGLRAAGYDAWAVGQEHSIITDLWRKQGPDVLITLDLPLSVVRQRRGEGWSAQIYAVQHQRLAPAFAASDLHIDSSLHDADAMLAAAVAFLKRWESDVSGDSA